VNDDEQERARLERCIELELVPRHVKRLARKPGEHPRDFIARYWCDRQVIEDATNDLNEALFGR
jgi:hypothetical protein